MVLHGKWLLTQCTAEGIVSLMYSIPNNGQLHYQSSRALEGLLHKLSPMQLRFTGLTSGPLEPQTIRFSCLLRGSFVSKRPISGLVLDSSSLIGFFNYSF
jgi:hypothetical protein